MNATPPPTQPPSPGSPGGPDPLRRSTPPPSSARDSRSHQAGEGADAPQRQQLREQVLERFDILSADFQETSDHIWRAISEASPEFEAQTASFITSHWDKFGQLRIGATWSSLKETLQEQMGQEQTVEGKKTVSWDGFRFQFIDLVEKLSNQALARMGVPLVKGHALGTTGWRSDVDWEICPTSSTMSETDLMLAKLVFDSITAHMLGREAKTTLGRESGSVLDIEFYTEHHAKRHDTFSLLTQSNTKSEFYVQELTMSALQQIRAFSDDMSQWKPWTISFLGKLEEGSNLRTVMSKIFDNVEKFEILLGRETLRQMLFETRVLEKGEGSDLKILRQEDLDTLWEGVKDMEEEELRTATAHLGGKESERYRLAQNELKAGRLLRLSQMIDQDTQQAAALLQQIEHLSASPKAHNDEEQVKIQEKQEKYEFKCLDASIKLALRTSCFEGAIYTQIGYEGVVGGKKGQRAQHAAKQELARRGSTGAHVVVHKPQQRPRSGSFSSHLKAAGAFEQLALLKQATRHRSPERDPLSKGAEVVADSKYFTRSVDALAASVELSQGEATEIPTLSYKTRELEKCKRRKILNQTSFGILLEKALTHLKFQNAAEIVEEAQNLFNPGGILYDEGAEVKLSPQEKYKPLIAFLNGKNFLLTTTSITGELSAQDPEIELILQSKVGSADHTKQEFRDLFDRAERETLKKLRLNTPEEVLQYYTSLDRTAVDVLEQAFKDVDFTQIRGSDLAELWNSTASA